MKNQRRRVLLQRQRVSRASGNNRAILEGRGRWEAHSPSTNTKVKNIEQGGEKFLFEVESK